MMTEVDDFVNKLAHSYDDVDTKEAEAIISEASDLVYGNPSKEEVKRITSALVNRFIGGYNSYADVAEFLDNNKGIKKKWNRARQSVFADNNAGWSMCVKQLLEDLS